MSTVVPIILDSPASGVKKNTILYIPNNNNTCDFVT